MFTTLAPVRAGGPDCALSALPGETPGNSADSVLDITAVIALLKRELGARVIPRTCVACELPIADSLGEFHLLCDPAWLRRVVLRGPVK